MFQEITPFTYVKDIFLRVKIFFNDSDVISRNFFLEGRSHDDKIYVI